MDTILNHYQQLVAFLGQILSPQYEIVLHWLDQNGSFSIAAIEHSEISGRSLNSPITGFALQLVRDKVYLKQDFVSDYIAETNHKKMHGATFFIKDSQNQLLGLLCINFDQEPYLDIITQLRSLGQLPKASQVPQEKAQSSEILHTSVDAIVRSVIDQDLLRPGTTLTQQKKIELCTILEQRGVFKIKGAIPQVAKLLNVSEPSIYRYLKLIEQQKNAEKY